jgi:hypothetical protein
VPDVRDLVTANQFHTTGLDARSPEQLTAFDTWLNSYVHPTPAGTPAADKQVDVRDLMSARQFHATGLDALNPEQVAAFNTWLSSYTHSAVANTRANSATVAAPALAPVPAVSVPVAPTPAPSASSSTDNFGKTMLTPTKRQEPVRIESTIPGHFTGWTGATVFTLANGQVWRQAESGYFETNLQNPAVVIKRLAIGYLLTLPSEGETVFVTRVQ